MSFLIRIENDNLLIVDKVQNALTGDFVNTAVVTATLKDGAGVDVVGQVFPLVLSYETGSDGKYVGILEDTLAVVTSEQHTLIIDIDAGGGLKANFQIPTKAIIRGAC